MLSHVEPLQSNGAFEAPLSVEYSRQEYWTDLPFPTPKDLHCQADFLPLNYLGSPYITFYTHTHTHTHTQCPQRVRGDTATMTQLKTRMFLFYNVIFKNQISRQLLEIKMYTTNSTPRHLPKRNK